jgi:putative ABC transport system permease protein
MFGNYLKTALRMLWKQRSYTFVNVVGLAFGMACFIFILLYVLFELSFDNFHGNADRIYRIAVERKYPDRVRLWGQTASPLAQTLEDEFPEVLRGTRLVANFRNTVVVRFGDKSLTNNRIVFADPDFFDVFTIPMVQGNPKEALSKPNSAVLTRESARTIFGDESPMGQTLNINNADYTVTGITENVPQNSHFHFDYLLSLITLPNVYDGQQWINAWGAYTYVVLREAADADSFEAKLDSIVKKYMAPEILNEVKVSYEEFVAQGNGYRYFIQPLCDIHLKSRLDQEIEPTSDITYVYLFSVISVFILLIACVNFMNLATARSANRAKEVGVRKTVGSSRKQLVIQFLFESTFFSGIALGLAMGMAAVSLPSIRAVTGIPFTFSAFPAHLAVPAIIGAVVLIGFIAGSYPALFLSGFEPAAALKGPVRKGPWVARMRNVLVVFQFTVSIVLIVGTLVVNRQIKYMVGRDLGYDKDSVLVVHNANVLGQQVEAFKREALRNPTITGVSGSVAFPGTAFDGNVHTPEGASDRQAVSLSMIFADYDYLPTMGMTLLAGRNFSLEYPTDATAYILNETAVRLLGLTDPVGSRITDHTRMFTVVGVVKDFHFRTLHSEISPVALSGNAPPFANFVSVRFRTRDVQGTVESVRRTWETLAGGRPFEYSFLDEDVAAQYAAEQRTRTLSGIFSALAVLIACLGLFGLAAFTAERRTKEIGIRKVVGATVFNLIGLLVRDFVKLVGVAFLIGAPIGYWAMDRWLENFAYHTKIGPVPFVVAGILAMGIAVLTVSTQAVKTALRNPVESLRYE